MGTNPHKYDQLITFKCVGISSKDLFCNYFYTNPQLLHRSYYEQRNEKMSVQNTSALSKTHAHICFKALLGINVQQDLN